MVQGTGSNVGKSLLVAGLGRAFTRRGIAVRPFKPQNMSNNAAVAGDGVEIGRAQALQARACGVAPTVDMNPVLLKPQSDSSAQIVVHGTVAGQADAREFHAWKPRLLPAALESFERLAGEAELVLVEGAGSPAEINLRDGDIANMGFAAAAEVPVILIGDIERGGVIASLIGTWTLLDDTERAHLKGLVVNKFRGDVTLFDDGIAAIEAHTGLSCLGVVPWFDAAGRLPAEDTVALQPGRPADAGQTPIRIAVPRLLRIANFDDFDPLAAEPDVALDIVEAGRLLPIDADLIILPGSKSTLADLRALRAEGWDVDIRAAVRRGTVVFGLCGGYQMLGRRVADPHGVDGAPGAERGLGLLDVRTVIDGDKSLVAITGTALAFDEAIAGYEMHLGKTTGVDCARPVVRFADGREDGASTADGAIAGCYVHGLFADDGFRHAFLAHLRSGRARTLAYEARIEATLDDLAAHLEAHLDLDQVLAIARGGVGAS